MLIVRACCSHGRACSAVNLVRHIPGCIACLDESVHLPLSGTYRLAVARCFEGVSEEVMEWAAVRCIPDLKDCALVAREAQCSELAAWTISNLEAIPNKPALHMADALDHVCSVVCVVLCLWCGVLCVMCVVWCMLCGVFGLVCVA